jgi:Asp-tRNA(Asn)/Glu-tRNA(Gln) amidotransferase A subunit family amidase
MYVLSYAWADVLDDNPEQWAGAPIGLQIVGQRLEEEKVIGMLCRIRDALKSQ